MFAPTGAVTTDTVSADVIGHDRCPKRHVKSVLHNHMRVQRTVALLSTPSTKQPRRESGATVTSNLTSAGVGPSPDTDTQQPPKSSSFFLLSRSDGLDATAEWFWDTWAGGYLSRTHDLPELHNPKHLQERFVTLNPDVQSATLLTELRAADRDKRSDSLPRPVYALLGLSWRSSRCDLVPLPCLTVLPRAPASGPCSASNVCPETISS